MHLGVRTGKTALRAGADKAPSARSHCGFWGPKAAQNPQLSARALALPSPAESLAVLLSRPTGIAVVIPARVVGDLYESTR